MSGDPCAHTSFTNAYLRDLAEGHSSRPLIDHIHQPEVKVELDVFLGVNRQTVLTLQPSEAASDGHHLSCRRIHRKKAQQYSAKTNTPPYNPHIEKQLLRTAAELSRLNVGGHICVSSLGTHPSACMCAWHICGRGRHPPRRRHKQPYQNNKRILANTLVQTKHKQHYVVRTLGGNSLLTRSIEVSFSRSGQVGGGEFVLKRNGGPTPWMILPKL